MRILVTNDDGIDSVGLHELARAMVPLGEVVVAAPDREYSGAGASVGALSMMRPEMHRAEIEGVPEAWAVTGPPALCVFFARMGALGDPFDLVVSGINPGENVGRSVYHSGTVGAAITARSSNINAIAVSMSTAGFSVEGQSWDEMLIGMKWKTAATIAAQVAEALLADLPKDAVVINLNVPGLDLDEIKGWRMTEVGGPPPRSMAAATLHPKEGHEGAFHVNLSWGDPVELPEEWDGGAVQAGYVSLTYLSRIVADDRPEIIAPAKALDSLFG